MATVSVDVREFNADGAPVPTTRTIKVTPWAVRNDGGTLITVRGDTVELVDGLATLTLDPGYYRITGAGGLPSRTVQVPEVPTISLAVLYTEHAVDPVTLETEAPPAWFLEIAEIREIIDGLEGADPEQIAAAVAAYLDANPVEGVTEAEVQAAITAALTPYATTLSVNEGLAGKVGTLTYNNGIAAAKARANHTGTQSADTITDGTTNKVYTAAEQSKLAGVATGATANAADAALRDRSTHTGTQPVSTLSDFVEAVQDTTAGMFRAGTNITFTYDDTAGTFTINALGGGGGTTDPETVRDTIAAALVGGPNLQVTVDDANDTITLSVTGLAPVATSGAYGDLTGKPTIPSTPGDIGAAPASHTHTASQVTDFQTAVSQNTDVSQSATARHTHANKATLDQVTAAYTTEEQTKLSSIASGATANATDAYLLARGNHTGTQPASTISDFTAAVQNTPGFGGGGAGASSVRNIDGPLAASFAALAARNMQSAVAVFLGSSSTAGQGASTAARNYVSLVTTHLQNMYPIGSGSENTVRTDLTTAPPATGVQVYNGGIGGTTTADYLTETRFQQIVALGPALISQIVGTNDSFGRRPELVKANLRYWLDRFQASLPRCRYFHALPFQRMDKSPGTGEYAWATYATVQAELAALDTKMVFRDLTPPFIAAGVPGADPLNLVGSDDLHPTDGGHQLLADTWMAGFRPEAPHANPATLTALTLATAPALTGTAEVGQTLTLSGDTWSETPDSRLYQWRRNGVVISGATSSTYTLVSADGGTRVDGQVIAIKASRASGSTWRTVNVSSGADTTAPTISSFSGSPGDSQVAWAWAGSDNVGITRWVLKNGSTTVYDGANSGYTETGLTNGTQVSRSLVAYDAAGNVSATSNASATPAAASDTTAPTISSFTATPGNGVVTLAWSATDNVGVTRYTVDRNSTRIYDGTATGYTDTGVTNGITYPFTLTAYDAAGNTKTASASATPTAPTGEGTVWASDGFGTTASNAGTRTSDNALGGTARTYFTVASTAFAQTTGGQLVKGTTNDNSYLVWNDTAPADISVSVKMVARPTGGIVRLVARYTGSSAYVSVEMKSDGEAFLFIAGNSTAYPGGTGAGGFAAGDTVTLRVIGTKAQILVNGVAKTTVTLTGPTAAGRAGLYIAGAATAFTLDDLVGRDLTGVTP